MKEIIWKKNEGIHTWVRSFLKQKCSLLFCFDLSIWLEFFDIYLLGIIHYVISHIEMLFWKISCILIRIGCFDGFEIRGKPLRNRRVWIGSLVLRLLFGNLWGCFGVLGLGILSLFVLNWKGLLWWNLWGIKRIFYYNFLIENWANFRYCLFIVIKIAHVCITCNRINYIRLLGWLLISILHWILYYQYIYSFLSFDGFEEEFCRYYFHFETHCIVWIVWKLFFGLFLGLFRRI